MSGAIGNWDRELEVAVTAAKLAAAEIKRFYDDATARVYLKAEDSPVTDADLASDRILREQILAVFPGDTYASEETPDDLSRLTAERVWIVDPLDGTQQFIDRTGDFDVFLALIIDHRPVVAVVCQPETGIVLSAVAGQGAWVEDEHGRRPLVVDSARLAKPARVATNRYHTPPAKWSRFVEAVTAAGLTAPDAPEAFFPRAFFDLPSSASRFDAYLGIGPDDGEVAAGGEWDVAAPDLILNEAGLRFTNHLGELFQYNQPNRELRSGVIVAIDSDVHRRLVEALNRV